MSPKERAIAEAALRLYSASNYEELFSEIAEYTGYSANDVEQILNDLITDKTLTDKYVPMLNPTPQLEGPAKIAQAWYEKGPMWDQPRAPRVW
jgi:hypothetical protein